MIFASVNNYYDNSIMDQSKNNEIQAFLNNLETIDSNLFNILVEMRALVWKTHPDFEGKIMYGGIVYFNNTEMLRGLFAYKKHVSIELSNGYKMEDPYQFLEGKGKFRRHVKVFLQEEIIGKKVGFYLNQLA